MCGNVIKKLLAGFGNSASTIGLTSGDGAESGQQCRIDSPSVVEEGADNVLNTFDCVGRQGSGCVDVHPLKAATVLDGSVFIGLMLGVISCWVLEF
jgi:hypothetical protein